MTWPRPPETLGLRAIAFLARLCRDRRDLQRIIAASACFLGVYSVRYMHCYWSG